MDNAILKKRLNTYKTAKGTLKRVSNDVVLELLKVWEQWPGKSSELYRELGLSKMQMVTLLKKAKKLVKEGVVVESEFKEIVVNSEAANFVQGSTSGIELIWDNGKTIRFTQVEQLVDFLHKVA